MAQTTGGASAVNAVVEYSLNGSSWTAASGHTNKVSVSGGDRKVGGVETFDGDTEAQTGGKRGLSKVKLEAIYTETASELQRDARTAWRAGSAFYLRWTVKAASTGNYRYTTAAGILTKAIVPDIDAGNPKSVMTVLELSTPDITDAAIA
jgi:hypothetical protein